MSPPENVAVSVLDTSPIVAGSSARTALRNTVDLARHTEDLGYHRYWVPEHHGMRGVASAAPAVVAMRVADATHRMRVGSGGVLLANHSPIVVAEQFGTLEAFHPGRIDLGVGRAGGGSAAAVETVRPGAVRDAEPFGAQLDELLGYLGPEPEGAVRAVPAAGNVPPVWVLGSSETGARLAAARGLPFAVAHHLRPDVVPAAVHAYRDGFRDVRGSGPDLLVSVSVIAADTDEHAEWLAGSTRLKVLSRVRGRPILLPDPAEAAAHPYTDDDRAEIAARSHSVLVGSPATLVPRLRAVLDETGARELMVTTPVHDHDERRHSYTLVAEAVRMLAAAPAAEWT